MHAYDLACFDKNLTKTHVKTAASIWIHTIQQIDGKSIVGLITGNEDRESVMTENWVSTSLISGNPTLLRISII